MDKNALLARATPTGTVDISGVGEIQVRGMTRAELAKAGTDDPELSERRVLAACMTDPVLTEDEVGQWQAVAPAGVILDVVEAINRLSGLSGRQERAEKEAYKSLRDRSGE